MIMIIMNSLFSDGKPLILHINVIFFPKQQILDPSKLKVLVGCIGV